MKKLLIVIFSTVILLSACKKDDQSVFNKSADERLNEALTAYQTQLAGALYGWKGVIYPKGGGTYTFYFKFNNSNRVQMLAGLDSQTAVTLRESSYRLKAVQQPSLLFDTYSYIHLLSDPDPYVNGGKVGVGLQSDFEFYFDSTSTDTINLVGRFNGSRARLIRATQAEATAFTSGRLASGLLLNQILTYYQQLTIGSLSADFHFDEDARIIKLIDDTGNLLDSSKMSAYYLKLGGIDFAKPLTVGNQVITGFNNVSFNAGTQTISCTVNNVAATVSPVIVPQKVDIAAARRWWISAATTSNYWYSFEGFHVNGVNDAYGISTLSSGTFPYYYLIYYPAYGTTNDLFGPVFLNAAANSLTLQYAAAPRLPTYTSDGRAIFTPAGNYGTYPSSGPAAATRAQLYNSNGYYFVQTSGGTYDMVGAENGKVWVSWISTQ